MNAGDPNEERLANPVWAALTSGQRHLAHALGDMLRYESDVAPFCAVAEEGQFVPAADLEYLTEDTYFVGAIPSLPDGWPCAELGGVMQMVYRGGPVALPPGGGIDRLDALDPGMLALTAVAFPGYFRPRTGTMGRYVGIREGGALIALAGERMDYGTLREVSGVCTHPEHTGKGHARRLIAHIMHGMQQRDVTPMLHVSEKNARAVALYESLGFEPTRVLRHVKVAARPRG